MCESGGEKSEWFESKVGLKQGCVMSPWLFNLYRDDVVQRSATPGPRATSGPRRIFVRPANLKTGHRSLSNTDTVYHSTFDIMALFQDTA